MDVVLREARPPLTPAPRQGDAQCVEDRRLAGVVRADEYGRFVQVHDEVPDRPEVADLDLRYTHSVLPAVRPACSTALAGTS